MSIHTVESAYHPKDKMGFLLDWLLTLKCNYDCAYCPIGPYGHDNSTQHPSYDRCITMLEQMFEYTDTVMSIKKPAFKDVIMNIYGGESIYHPRITDIIEATTRLYEKYSDNWRLRKRITTNGTASEKNWKILCDHTDGFTMSYHSTGPAKLKNLFKKNLEYLVSIKKEYDMIVCMYPREWKDCIDFLNYCRDNKFNVRPKLLDGPLGVYSSEQLNDLKEFMDGDELDDLKTGEVVMKQARGCCGGRKMCFNRNIKETHTLVPRGPMGFKGWHCSANQFFLHGNNVSGEYFTNKDCHVRLDGTRGPIATIDDMQEYIDKMKTYTSVSFPTLVCAQSECLCGTCAPKSTQPGPLKEILQIYNK